MKLVLHFIVIALLAFSLSGCGNKGNLKTPEQVEAQKQKKLRKEEKRKREAEEEAKIKTEAPIQPELQEAR